MTQPSPVPPNCPNIRLRLKLRNSCALPPFVEELEFSLGAHQMFGSRSKYSSSSFVPPSPLPTCFSDSINSIRSIHLTIL